MHNFQPPEKPAGGWSAHGQPVDQLHSQYRKLIRSLDLISCNFHENLLNRPAFEDLPLRSSGPVNINHHPGSQVFHELSKGITYMLVAL
jgi:hypothetical protein